MPQTRQPPPLAEVCNTISVTSRTTRPPVGLVCSILTQFTGNVYGTDVAGVFQCVPLNKDGLNLVGKSFPEKITFGAVNWFFHMVIR